MKSEIHAKLKLRIFAFLMSHQNTITLRFLLIFLVKYQDFFLQMKN